MCTFLDAVVTIYSVATLARTDPRQTRTTKQIFLVTALFAAVLLLAVRRSPVAVTSLFAELAFYTTIALGNTSGRSTVAAHVALCLRAVVGGSVDSAAYAGATVLVHLASIALVK
ncbi:hypothetical protein IWW48_001084 [Coemansia sp. RSA 1200]|nr:hypothetical protein IWW48_001084 [Coemansia sp. RSA 1200]